MQMQSENELRQAFSAIKGVSLPELPEVIILLQHEMLEKKPDIKKIAVAIKKDLLLSSTVLKQVNSANFGLSQKIESINQAVIMLGLSKIKEIILSASLNVPLKFYDNQNPYTNQYQYLPPIQKPGTNPFFR